MINDVVEATELLETDSTAVARPPQESRQHTESQEFDIEDEQLQTVPAVDDTRMAATTSTSSATHNSVQRSHLKRWQNAAASLRQIVSQVSSGKYVGTALGRHLHGAAMTLSPQTSFESM